MSAAYSAISGDWHAVDFASLSGFATADCGPAFAAFHRLAVASANDQAVLRPARPIDDDLRIAFAAALAIDPLDEPDGARRFFAGHFTPWRIDAEAFFTGYYEPIVDGDVERSPACSAPLLARPADLKTLVAHETRPDWGRELAAVKVGPDGTWAPYPERAAIEQDALAGAFRPLVWLRDWVEVFLVHVQGSARVRLPDGRMLRLTYAGRNGHPYTSIGRLLVERGDIPLHAMSLERLKGWLRANGQEPGQPGRALMQRNASYIFFDAEPCNTDRGPTGGAGQPLTPLTSIAVDRTRWCYGLPFWVDVTAPWSNDTPAPLRRLMIAEDTGSAIVGPARVDLFMGSGDDAGQRAGAIRHRGSLTVLRPRPPGSVR